MATHRPPPANPIIGQLYFDHPTGTMRKWDGKHWAEQPKPGQRPKPQSTTERKE